MSAVSSIPSAPAQARFLCEEAESFLECAEPVDFDSEASPQNYRRLTQPSSVSHSQARFKSSPPIPESNNKKGGGQWALGALALGGGYLIGGPLGLGVAALLLGGCHSVEEIGLPPENSEADGSANMVSDDASDKGHGKDGGMMGGCTEGDQRVSYSGEKGKDGVGICREEIQECRGGTFVTIQEEVLPQTEVLDEADNDCDTEIDEGFWLQVSAGMFHTCGVKADGTVACWGDDGNGQSSPPSGTFTQVSAGGEHTCGLRTDDAIECWGSDGAGQSTPPSKIFLQVDAGLYHTCGVWTSGAVVCWGHNSSGQSSPPSGTFTQVSAGEGHTCGIRTDGAVECWGESSDGQTNPPSGRFSQVSAGLYYTCGVRTSGAVACWGYNNQGQSTPPSGTFTQVSAGSSHTCGIKTDGAIECWGQGIDGQTDPPSGSFSQVSAGESHTCGLRLDNTIACWGNDKSGQATPP